jgi:O-antigen/teichoic acid export membrane protein
MAGLINRGRVTRLASFASTQLAVQVIGFASGVVLVRHMEQVQYGYYTLSLSMVSIANILSDLGLATAVMAIGGRLIGKRGDLGHLVSDASVLHRRLALLSFGVLVPCFVVLLLRQQAAAWQVAALTLLIVASALLNVRNAVALSIARLLGHVALQQKLDLAVNLAKLAVLMLATWLVLDATVACVVNFAAAVVYFVVLRRHLASTVGALPAASGEHAAALRQHLWKQAPNSVYFVVSSQLAVWLVGIFGSAERVAEVGALSRLGAVFTIIGAVSAALILPYFARHDGPAELTAGFIGVNGFFAAVLAALVALAILFPEPILWVLGGSYGTLHSELVWMVVAATLSAWGGTIYSIGCARGWVLPVVWSMSAGVVATATAASLVDVSSVRGSFMINTAAGLAGTVVAIGYFAWQLRRHSLQKAQTP